MPKLLVLLPDGVSTEYELSDALLTIGRGSNNTIKIDDQKASRNHCEIAKDGDGTFHVKDLDSRNGTKLNGLKIAARVKLKPGDVIRIGRTKFAFEKFPEGYQDDDDGVPDTIAEGAEEPKYVLEVVEGKSPGGIIELKDGVTTFGRKPSNDVTVDDDKASGSHCEVRKEAMGYILVDLDSTNGTKFRAAGKTDYEKVTKVPLSVGSEFRIGATVYRYKNIGAANPDDEVLAEVAGGKVGTGTARHEPVTNATTTATNATSTANASGTPGHTGKTVHTPRPVTSPMAMAGLGVVVAVAVLAVVGYLVLRNNGSTTDTTTNVIPDVGPQPVTIPNGNFQAPANADGQPVHWSIGEHGKQRSSEVSDPKEPPTTKNMVCEVDRTPAASADAVYELRSEHINEIKQGGAYSLKMRLRSTTDAEGAFGVKLQFFSSKNEVVAEYPYLLTGPHDGWYQLTAKEFLVKAPDQPTYGQLVLMAAGNKGQVFFDDVQLTYVPAENPPHLPDDITNGLVSYRPRDFTGAFAVTLNHLPALGHGHMAIINKRGNVVSGPDFISLDDMTDKNPKAKIYNEIAGEWIEYSLNATASGKGIQLTITPKSRSSDPQYHLALLIDLMDNYADSKVDSIGADGDVKNLAGSEEEVAAGTAAQEILFSKDTLSLSMAGSKANNLVLAVSRLTGKQRTVTILCDNAVDLFLAADSETLTRTSAQMADQIGDTIRNRAWSAATKQTAEFTNRYGNRFPALSARLKGYNDAIAAAANQDLSDANALIPGSTVTTSVAKPILDTLQTYVTRWKDTTHQPEFEALLVKMNTHIQDGPVVDAAAIAKQFQELEARINVAVEQSKTDDMLNPLTQLTNDYTVLVHRNEANDAGKAGADKLKGYKDILARIVDENNLLDAAANFVTAGQYQQAIAFVQANPVYKKYPEASLTRLEAAMKRWKENKP